ncbi:hypothetical protein QQX98_008481 [Neonectria punicea]|uniref:Uncharacterized protein n=1 Tax=Neonectria punicea TaxID=979145 RepID=A0ABR1GV03_9HYPO
MAPAPKIGSNRPGPNPAAGKQSSSKQTPFKVIVVGARVAGIDFLHHSLTAFKGLNVDVRCLDKNTDVGGTCTIASLIWEYMKGIVLDKGLDRFIQLNIQFSYNDMTTKLKNDARLVDKIVPNNFNKTTTFTETIHSITPNGFKDQAGNEYECDVIIAATGFDTSYRPRFPVIGLDGVVLAERWAELPESYMGVAAPKMPNYFMFTGPFTPVAHGSILPIITHMTNCFIQLIRKMCEQHIRRVTPKDAIVSHFIEHCRAYLRRTCWVDPYTSWFKQGKPDGPLVMWPGSRLAFFEAVKSPNFEDYNIAYWSSNRFGYLRSGFAWYEFGEDGDTTPYLDGGFVPALPRKQVQELMARSQVKKLSNGHL